MGIPGANPPAATPPAMPTLRGDDRSFEPGTEPGIGGRFAFGTGEAFVGISLVEAVCGGIRPGWIGGAPGGPRLEREKAFIFAMVSSFRPLERVERGAPGRRAAFRCPSGVDEAVMVAE